jgi:hypothetical protein
MTRQLLLGIAAAAALGAATLLTPAPSYAQSWSLSIGQGGGHYQGFRDDFRQHRGRDWQGGGWQGGDWNRGHGPWDGGWRGRQAYSGGYGHGFGHYQPHCVVRKVRYWDGWGWVVDRRRVCN